MRTDRQTDRQTDMTKLTVVYRNFTNAAEKELKQVHIKCFMQDFPPLSTHGKWISLFYNISHSMTHTWWHSSGQEIGLTQRLLPNTQDSQERLSRLEQDSNPQSQQARAVPLLRPCSHRDRPQ
jgi:hypothetical protein